MNNINKYMLARGSNSSNLLALHYPLCEVKIHPVSP